VLQGGFLEVKRSLLLAYYGVGRNSLRAMFGSLLGVILVTVPGPDSVVVVANAARPQSVALGRSYQIARQIPRQQLCSINIPESNSLSLAAFRTDFLAPLKSCMAMAEVSDRIEAFVLMKGLPLRVSIPTGQMTRSVSLAAALMVADSTLSNGEKFLGQPPGRITNCGSMECYSARWANPFKGRNFGPGWTDQSQGVDWKLRLVTMLNGRSYDEAKRLILSATTAEALGGSTGSFIFMEGGDTARAHLDHQYDAIIESLHMRGYLGAQKIPFDSNSTGLNLASFIVGTSALETTIEGNHYEPGSLVDNLTSFGAVPINFSETGESQVSIARWVAQGVAGVHGTTGEPLSNSFPDRNFLLDYVDGMTLAQAFYRRMPFVYWQNLVLGDPMAAPYATRPEVLFEGLPESGLVRGSTRLRVTARDAMFRGIATLKLYVDGKIYAQSQGAPLDLCAVLPQGEEVELLAVAQVFGVSERFDQYLPKGWNSTQVRVVAGSEDCSEEEPDAGFGFDAGISDVSEGLDSGALSSGSVEEDDGGLQGCRCRAGGAVADRDFFFLFVFGGLLLRRHRHRGR
jgi:uncharacterized protein (TIGR03790 family)